TVLPLPPLSGGLSAGVAPGDCGAWRGDGLKRRDRSVLGVLPRLHQLVDGIAGEQLSVAAAEPALEDDQGAGTDAADLTSAEELGTSLASAVGDGDVESRTVGAARLGQGGDDSGDAGGLASFERLDRDDPRDLADQTQIVSGFRIAGTDVAHEAGDELEHPRSPDLSDLGAALVGIEFVLVLLLLFLIAADLRGGEGDELPGRHGLLAAVADVPAEEGRQFGSDLVVRHGLAGEHGADEPARSVDAGEAHDPLARFAGFGLRRDLDGQFLAERGVQLVRFAALGGD